MNVQNERFDAILKFLNQHYITNCIELDNGYIEIVVFVIMKIIWIIGAGRFGSLALKRLSKQHKDWQFVLVDKIMEKLSKVKGPNITTVNSDGIMFLKENLKLDAGVSWIIPSLPVHLAGEWYFAQTDHKKLVKTQLPFDIDSLLPNPIHGKDGNVYVSNADFLCPDNCSEPKNMCTVTKLPRKQDMFSRLESLNYKEYIPIVLRSRQLGPGIGGYSPEQLFSFLKQAEQQKGSMLLCTACRCHGVITAVNVI